MGLRGLGGEDNSMVCLVVVLLHGACTPRSLAAAAGRVVLMKIAAVEDLGVKRGLAAAGWLKCWANRSVVVAYWLVAGVNTSLLCVHGHAAHPVRDLSDVDTHWGTGSAPAAGN